MKIVPLAAAAALLGGCSAQAEQSPSEQASSEAGQPTQFEGAEPVTLVFVVDPDFVGVVIESPMENYGITSNLVIPPENHGVPEFDDYNDLRDEISRAIADDIDDIEPSIGSKFAFNQTAGCSYDEGSESIFKRDGQWMVTFDIEFACRQPANLQDVSVNLFDMGGFSSGSAKVVNGDAEAVFDINGINRKVDLN